VSLPWVLFDLLVQMAELILVGGTSIEDAQRLITAAIATFIGPLLSPRDISDLRHQAYCWFSGTTGPLAQRALNVVGLVAKADSMGTIVPGAALACVANLRTLQRRSARAMRICSPDIAIGTPF
jgi:hypothetical protein